MSTTPSTEKRRPADIVALLARWLLGGLFIYLGGSNVRHGADFLSFVRQQLSVTDPTLSSLIATIAPGLPPPCSPGGGWAASLFIWASTRPCRTRSISWN